MIEVLCTIAVIYIAVDLLGSAYLIRRFGGIRGTVAQIRSNWAQATGDYDDDDDTCDCGCSDDC
jgi:hypothetical protein